jgi:hypothetical protein
MESDRQTSYRVVLEIGGFASSFSAQRPNTRRFRSDAHV